jgi:hypothetical protein
MKKTFKILGRVFLVLIVIGATGRCIKTAVFSGLRSDVERANNECPIQMAGGAGQVTSIKYEETNTDDAKCAVVYYLDFKPEYINSEVFKENPEASRALLFLSMSCMNGQDGNGNMLLEELLKNDAALKFVINQDSPTECVVWISPAYMKKMKNHNESPSQALLDGLALMLEMQSKQFPIAVDEGMTATGMHLEGNNIVYEVDCDESIYSIDAIRDSSNDIVTEILSSASSDADICALFDLCKVSHTGLIYRYKGKQSGDVASIQISSDVIRERHQTPSQAYVN